MTTSGAGAAEQERSVCELAAGGKKRASDIGFGRGLEATRDGEVGHEDDGDGGAGFVAGDDVNGGLFAKQAAEVEADDDVGDDIESGGDKVSEGGFEIGDGAVEAVDFADGFIERVCIAGKSGLL